MEMDWSRLELQVFSTDGAPAWGWVALPSQGAHNLQVVFGSDGPVLVADPLQGQVRWSMQVRTLYAK